MATRKQSLSVQASAYANQNYRNEPASVKAAIKRAWLEGYGAGVNTVGLMVDDLSCRILEEEDRTAPRNRELVAVTKRKDK